MKKTKKILAEIDVKLQELEHFRRNDLRAYREWFAWTFEQELKTEPSKKLNGWNSHWASEAEHLSEMSLKSTYRCVVRVLHPDASGVALNSALWEEVQQYYKVDDLEALLEIKERLLYEQRVHLLEESGGSEKLDRLNEELSVSLAYLEAATNHARESYAWGFLKRKSLGPLKRRIKDAVFSKKFSLMSTASAADSKPLMSGSYQMSLF